MLGCGSAGKFHFLSLLVNQLAPWIRCVFHGNNKVHRANKALKQLGFAFLSYLGQGARSLSFFYNCGRSFAGNHCLRIEIFSFSDEKKVLDAFDRHCWDAACCSRMSEVRDYRCSLRAVKWFSAFPLISWLDV